MSQPLWLTIEPHPEEMLLSLHEPFRGSVLRARLPLCPCQPRALATLLESLVARYGRPLVAVLDADAQDVRQHGERWGPAFWGNWTRPTSRYGGRAGRRRSGVTASWVGWTISVLPRAWSLWRREVVNDQ
jgi:hypothetical protein